jgi:hypothetical protein
MSGFRCQRRLTQGPAVKLADRRHSLRRCMVTGREVRMCWSDALSLELWSEHGPRYAVKNDPKPHT